MKIVVISTVLLLFSFGKSGNEVTVYICDSPYATKYHYKKDCEGLQKCTHAIKEVKLTDVQAKYNLCGYEKKKK